MKVEAQSRPLNQKLLSSLDEAKNIVSGKLTSARAMTLVKVIDAGDRLTEKQIALLDKLKERAAQ